MRKSTACSLLWGYVPWVTAKLPVFEVLLPGTLLSPWLAEFAASIIFLEDATCEMIALSNTCRLHMIRSQAEELSGSFSSFHAKPIQGRPYIVAKKDTNFRRQKRTQNKPLIPACLDHDNLSLAVVMLMKDVPCIESWFELSKVCNRGASRHFAAQRGLSEATPRTKNILAQGQSEAHGDSKLYNTSVGVPAGLNLK